MCAALFAQGGFEAALLAAAGAFIGARRSPPDERLRGLYAGGFVGLFVGAMFAAFFHGALVALVRFLS